MGAERTGETTTTDEVTGTATEDLTVMSSHHLSNEIYLILIQPETTFKLYFSVKHSLLKEKKVIRWVNRGLKKIRAELFYWDDRLSRQTLFSLKSFQGM